jgi:tetratricopeptide (TPR) repeat protein
LQNLGGALSRLDRRAELDGWLERALAAEPQTAALHGMLAAQHLAFGRLNEAVQAMDRMIALDPADGLAHAFLSEMKTYTPGDRHLVALERAVSQGAARPANERCVVRYALAKAYSDVGRDEDAFRLRLEASRLRRQTIEYDLAHTLSEFQSLQSVFTPQLMQAKRGLGDPSDRPVFIVGMMRSGTTLVEQILTSHARVFGFGEMPNFRDAVARAIQRYPEEVAGLSADDLRRIGAHYLGLSAAAAGGAARVTDKTLVNDVFVGLIHLALPHARIIHVVRDPVDTCLSAFAMNFGTSYPYTCDLSELGRYYRAQRRMMKHWRALLPESAFLEVRYENLVADIESEVRHMLRFCDLDWDPAVLAFDSSARAVWTASAAQVRRPLYKSSVDRWRPSPELLRPLLEGLGEYAPS